MLSQVHSKRSGLRAGCSCEASSLNRDFEGGLSSPRFIHPSQAEASRMPIHIIPAIARAEDCSTRAWGVAPRESELCRRPTLSPAGRRNRTALPCGLRGLSIPPAAHICITHDSSSCGTSYSRSQRQSAEGTGGRSSLSACARVSTQTSCMFSLFSASDRRFLLTSSVFIVSPSGRR